jgi:gentisate 1,2-dioxygenase
MNELGRLEDPPADYCEAPAQQHLVPPWPSLRAVLPPGEPLPRTRATHWSCEALRPLLLKAADQPGLEAAQVTYTNPETGGHAETILGFHALMLRPGRTLKLPVLSPARCAPPRHPAQACIASSRRSRPSTQVAAGPSRANSAANGAQCQADTRQ